MFKRFLIICFIIYSMVSCNNDSISKRAQLTNVSKDIYIAVIDSSNTPSRFTDGVKMAIEELNENGITGKPIKAIYYDDQGSIQKAQKIAWEIADNPNIIAAIGHFSSKIALSVSITYEKNGIIFITPKATLSDLIRDTNAYTFRNIPSDNIIGLEMAKFAHRKKFKKMAIIYERESSGKRLAEIFQKYGDKLGIKFSSVKSYSPWNKDFRPLISDLRNESFDSILICGNLPSSAYIVKQLRDMTIDVPIIGSDSMDSMQLLNIAGKASDGVTIPTVFDPKIPHNVTRYFVENFKYFYGFEPDTLAAQGYDAIKVLGHAIEKGGTSNPVVISTNLRFLKNWRGVTGQYSFTRRGDIVDKTIYFKSVVKDKFVFVERLFDKKIETATPVKDIALRIPVSQISDIDPINSKDPVSIEISEQLFLGLTDIDPKTYAPVPELATHWRSDEACKKWIFFLRKDVIWTDGRPVTAVDIQQTIQRNLTVLPNTSGAQLLMMIKGASEISNGKYKDFSKLGVTVLDAYQIEFELNQSTGHFPIIAGLWMFRPLPVDIINEFGESWTNPENIQTNGSYTLHVWEKGIQMILRKNELYYDAENVNIPEIHCYVISDPMLSLSLYYNQELDIVGGNFSHIPLTELPTISKNPFLAHHYVEEPAQCSDVFLLNMNKNPMDNILVRKAIAFASDRHTIIHSLELPTAQILNTFTPETLFTLHTPQRLKNNFNPQKAKHSLAEAGYDNGENFPQISIGFVDTDYNKNVSLSLKRLLEFYLNISVKLVCIGKDNANATDFDHCDIRYVRKCADYPDSSDWLTSLKTYGIVHPTLTQLLEKSSTISQEEKRKQSYLAAERFLIDDLCAIIPIYQENDQILVHPRIDGWYQMSFGGQHFRDWRLIND